MRPLVVELYAGSFGWSAAWLEMGGAAVGFDLEHLPHHGRVPAGAELVLQDVTTLHGSQFRNAALILASPPCHEFCYMAMPWKRSKHIAAVFREEIEDFPSNYHGSKTLAELTELFDACFRIQREACEAAGRYIPMVVKNVNGAQKWVGAAKARFGSYYLWGDVESVGGAIVGRVPRFGEVLRAKPRMSFKGSGNWFAPHIRLDGTLEPVSRGRAKYGEWNGTKQAGSGAEWFDKALDERRKQVGEAVKCGDWFGSGNDMSPMRRHNSKSDSRKAAASAAIARIPLALSRYIAQVYYPDQEPVN